VTKEEAEAFLGFRISDEWSFVEVLRHDILAGFVMVSGNEIHCWRKPEHKGLWLTKHNIRNIIKPLIERYGCVVTKVRNENNTGHRFVTRLGFEKVSKDDYCTYYRIERLNHA